MGPANYYHAPTRTVVVSTFSAQGDLLRGGAPARIVMHERCHAHQHLVVLAELGFEPSIDLREWAATSEGSTWIALTGGRVSPFKLSAASPLEDFAEVCARYFTGPGALQAADPTGYDALLQSIR